MLQEEMECRQLYCRQPNLLEQFLIIIFKQLVVVQEQSLLGRQI